jgi:hypothetical protein
VENEAIQRVVVVGRNQARRLTDRTIDVGDNPTGSANDVMVVVADPTLIAGNHSQWLDPPEQTYRRQRVEDVVHGLAGHIGQAAAYCRQDRLGIGMRMRMHRL